MEHQIAAGVAVVAYVGDDDVAGRIERDVFPITVNHAANEDARSVVGACAANDFPGAIHRIDARLVARVVVRPEDSGVAVAGDQAGDLAGAGRAFEGGGGCECDGVKRRQSEFRCRKDGRLGKVSQGGEPQATDTDQRTQSGRRGEHGGGSLPAAC